MPKPDVPGTLILEDARIIIRNFEGKEGPYNRRGDRNFCVLLDPEVADAMIQDRWNVKTLRPQEGEEVGAPYIQVSVGFKIRPPKLVLISSKGRVNLGQHECELLDWVDIKQADMIIRPYPWEVQGKTGIKAYVKSLFITLDEDYLDKKYEDVPMAEGGQVPLSIEQGNYEIVEGEVVD